MSERRDVGLRAEMLVWEMKHRAEEWVIGLKDGIKVWEMGYRSEKWDIGQSWGVSPRDEIKVLEIKYTRRFQN